MTLLRSLQLHDTGPIADATLVFGDRLNLLTGDNGLGKTFLLDVIWWALTGAWPQVPLPADAMAPGPRSSRPGRRLRWRGAPSRLS